LRGSVLLLAGKPGALEPSHQARITALEDARQVRCRNADAVRSLLGPFRGVVYNQSLRIVLDLAESTPQEPSWPSPNVSKRTDMGRLPSAYDRLRSSSPIVVFYLLWGTAFTVRQSHAGRSRALPEE
jgi:hypothetical protein